MAENILYSEAYEELETIVNDIENEDISVDDLSAKVKRAAMLIRICREKLSKTEEEVNKILAEIKEGGNSSGEE